MNRTHYYNYIEEHLITLSTRIQTRGKLNILDVHIHSETFFANLCNFVFHMNFKNMNEFKHNVESIDLIDDENKVIIQVSATCTKQKIESSLNKEILALYANYKYMFISISKDASPSLMNTIFNNPYTLSFIPSTDIIDKTMLLRTILYMDIVTQKLLYEFVKAELGGLIDVVKVDSNLATIIKILADENLSAPVESLDLNEFEILKKIEFNDLLQLKSTIDDYKIYYHKINEKYSEFDKGGSNKSMSVLQMIKKEYSNLLNKDLTSKEVFIGVSNNILNLIISSKNYKEIPYEELVMCVDILIVDAFMKCKIFKNPRGYQHVIT